MKKGEKKRSLRHKILNASGTKSGSSCAEEPYLCGLKSSDSHGVRSDPHDAAGELCAVGVCNLSSMWKITKGIQPCPVLLSHCYIYYSISMLIKKRSEATGCSVSSIASL